MKLHVLSDLHNELYRWEPVPNIEHTDADVIILAGDIDKGTTGIEWAIEESIRLNKPIIYLAGNHEYYGYEYTSTLQSMRHLANETSVHFLECNEWVFNETRFLGCTLWTDFAISGDAKTAMQEAKSGINDYRRITYANQEINAENNTDASNASQTRPLAPNNTLQIHRDSVKWLSDMLAKPFQGKTVVITHHGPSRLCQHPDYGISHVSASFYSDLENLLLKADIWVYGHTHACKDITLEKTRMVSNQRGYKDYESVADFNSQYVIKI